MLYELFYGQYLLLSDRRARRLPPGHGLPVASPLAHGQCAVFGGVHGPLDIRRDLDATPDPVPSGRQIVRTLQLHLQRAHEGVVLRLCVRAHLLDQFLAEHHQARAVQGMIIGVELDDETVGGDGTVVTPDPGVDIALASERADELQGLHRRLESFGEGAVDPGLEAPLQLVQRSHCEPSSMDRPPFERMRVH